MDIRIESVGRERAAEVLAPVSTAMGFELPPEALEEFAQLPEYDVRLAALDDGAVIGGLGSFTFELTTPGGSVALAGLTGVGVLPTHRRRGALRELMRFYLDGVRTCGQSVSALWASEAPIYGRFGYGMASLQGEVELRLDRAAFVGGRDPDTRARLLDAAEALDAFPAIFDAVRAETPGMLSRSEDWWQLRRLGDPEFSRRGRGPLRRVLLELEGGAPAAYALYRQTHEWQNAVPGGSVHVIEALGTTPAATRAIWRYLCGLDLMDKLTGFMLPSDHPLLLLLAEPRRLGLRLADALWVRLVEVGAALSARSFAVGPPITIEIHDSFCPWNSGHWSVGARGVERTDGPADLAVDVAELGSVYLGGFTFGQLARAGLVEELVEGAVARADGLFVRDRAPWCPEIF